MFCQKPVLKYFAKFTGRYLCWSFFFKKVAGLTPATFLKRRLQYGFYPVNLRNTFLYRISPVAASIVQRLVLPFVTNHTGRIVFF